MFLVKRWFAKRKRARRLLEALARAEAIARPIPNPADDPVSVHSVLNDLAKVRLESEVALAKIAVDEKLALSEERKEIRAEQRLERDKNREARQKAAANAREQRALKRAGGQSAAGDIPPFANNCEDCRAKLEHRDRAHTRDMIRHAEQQHDILFREAPGAN